MRKRKSVEKLCRKSENTKSKPSILENPSLHSDHEAKEKCKYTLQTELRTSSI